MGRSSSRYLLAGRTAKSGASYASGVGLPIFFAQRFDSTQMDDKSSTYVAAMLPIDEDLKTTLQNIIYLCI